MDPIWRLVAVVSAMAFEQAAAPVPPGVAQAMMEMAQVGRGDLVYDLGPDRAGRMVVDAARHAGARGRPLEVDGRADLLRVDLRRASVVTVDLSPEMTLALRPRLLEQLRPGARVISHNHPLGDWQPDATRTVGDHVVYLWIVPAAVGGNWQWELPFAGATQAYEIDIDQHFQQLSGGVVRVEPQRRTAVPLIDPTLIGNRLSFSCTESIWGKPVTARYRATVNGDVMVGTVALSEGASVTEHAWTAHRRRPAAAVVAR
jgi:hypothetical protein